MEIKILKGHENKEALHFLYPALDQQDAENHYIQEKLTLMKEHHLLLFGAYDKNLVGVVAVRDFQTIEHILVLENYRHMGIGTQLLESAKKMIVGHIYARIEKLSQNFFLANGFVYEEDMLVFESENAHCFTTYDQVHDFIASQKDRVYALDNFKTFMDDMGNPQKLLKTIHIGGTNGKGSTTNYLRSVLQTQGYRVATFTSPSLVTRLEVMRINNQNIAEDEIVQYANRYMSLWLEYEISMFEIEVFIAIMYFLKNGVDFAIFEVGLGGELDATNIVSPIISAITNIGLDHTEYLGDTYEKIAYTKGGIIKPYKTFVTGEKKAECLRVFQDICQQRHVQMLEMDEIKNIQDDHHRVTYDYRGIHVCLNTTATYQCENSALAIEILLYLKQYGHIELSMDNLKEGLYQAVWAGRFEVVHQNPLIIIDGAHNKEGMNAFYHSAKKYENKKVIFSALRDKDTHAMLELLLKLTDDVTVCEFDFYRAQSAIKLAENFPVKIEKDWKKAVDEAFLHNGTVFITGSLYFIAQVRSYLKNRC